MLDLQKIENGALNKLFYNHYFYDTSEEYYSRSIK